jgi:hypothetical protein
MDPVYAVVVDGALLDVLLLHHIVEIDQFHEESIYSMGWDVLHNQHLQ